ncbi:MAG: DUF1566 domain-containing protein [Methylovulum sp.]
MSLFIALISGCANQNPPIKPVSSVDLNQYMGDWYVIAFIPTVFETDVYNAVEFYQLVNKKGSRIMIGFKETATVVLLTAGLILAHTSPAAETNNQPTSNENNTKPVAKYRLGDQGPMGGKVYYVADSGEHGLEAKTADEINTLSWNDAVTVASAYSAGWHLPTKTELKILYEQRHVVGGFAKDDYWSSTELDSNSAWIQGFFNGDQDRYNKYSKLSVRVVRAF